MESTAKHAMAAVEGIGVPTVKPWNAETVSEKLALCKEAGSGMKDIESITGDMVFMK